MGLGRKLALVATAATAVAAMLPGAAAGAAPSGSVAWKPCPTGKNVECGTVTVPIDWDHPDHGTIQLALARRKATDPSARIGSILMDPGGPGGSGAGEVQDGWSLSPEITRRFDTVGFDPRGVGQSNPVRCGLTEVTAPDPQLPKNASEYAQLTAYNRALGASCAKNTGPLAGFADTKSVVHDMDAIRAALGEAKLTYYGVSYGSLMGQQYAETYPDRVRALVLDSNMDHSLRTTWEFLSTETASTQELFEQFASWCGRTASCALHGQDVHALMATLYSRAESGDLGTPDDRLDPVALVNLVSQNFYGPTWGQLATTMVNLRDGKPAQPSAFGDITVPSAFGSVFCADWKLPVSGYGELETYRRALAAMAPDMRFSPLGWTSTAGCIDWPGEVRNPQHRLSVHGAPPLLMLNSRYDPATPYPWAQRAAQQSGATLLTYDGWGHGAYFKNSDCVIKAADDYLISGTVPRKGTHCAAVEPKPQQSRMDGPTMPPTTLFGR
jgi:pimeloyl-ACP methyl ester carboxylesterase